MNRNASNRSPMKLLSTSIGDFISYWGFRRIHGQIWTQIYLSKEPLSGVELMKGLGVSKALVSPALRELLEFKLIQAEESADGRIKKYSASPKVFEVILEILNTREKVLIEKAESNYLLLKRSLNEKNPITRAIEPKRLNELGEMISAAKLAIHFIIESSGEDGDTFLKPSILTEFLTK